MKHCTQKTSDVLLNKSFKMFPAASLRHDEQELEVDITKVQFWLPFVPQQGDRQRADVIP